MIKEIFIFSIINKSFNLFPDKIIRIYLSKRQFSMGMTSARKYDQCK